MFSTVYKSFTLTFIKSLPTKLNKNTLLNIRTFSNSISSNIDKQLTINNDKTIDKTDKIDKRSILEPCQEDISHFTPSLRPSFNFAAYVDKSHTLQELIKLGVNLYKLEKKKNVAEFLLRLDFDRDIKKYLLFLHEHGVTADNFGKFLTKNPMFLNEDLDYLNVRVQYLKNKQFTPFMIAKIIGDNPFWLMFSTERIDRRLGYFQTTFSLSGDQVRTLAFIKPKLITYSLQHVRVNTFVIREELGFKPDEVKRLLLKRPKLWMIDQKNLAERFTFVHKQMNISHERILQMPDILYYRLSHIRERHLFLMKLNRAQYDPTMENYVSLLDLVRGTDAEFCTNIAKSTPAIFNAFLKTL